MISLHRGWLSQKKATQLLELAEILPLEQRSITIAGKKIPMPRLTGWMNDLSLPYYYSGQQTEPIPWHSDVLDVKSKIEALVGRSLNSVLINYYRSGSDSVSWHKDDEKFFKSNPFIVSLSCGATRKFKLRHTDTKTCMDLNLEHGDLLILADEHILDWEHSIPKTKKFVEPRINFTFRIIEA